MAAPNTPDAWNALFGELTESFSPGAPIEERELFAGRLEELAQLVDAVRQRGRHAIVFGERGVGKTSLANILRLILSGLPHTPAYVRVSATPDDTFASLWRKVFKRLSYPAGSSSRQIADDYPKELTPDDVQLELSNFSSTEIPLVVLDEFDRIKDKAVTTLVADTIKALSDYSVNVTVVIVGIAENVQELIVGHESISRSLMQIRMPRMTMDELARIIHARYQRSGFSVKDDALWKMTFLSRGLPYYAHLLGMYAGRSAAQEERLLVSDRDVEHAVKLALTDIDQAIKERFHSAITTQRKDTLFFPVLVACALATTDELGRFQQAAVEEPLSTILGERKKATTYAFHLNAMCTPERGPVLERKGEANNPRYRFADPMMQPYTIMKALSENLITDETAKIFETRRQLNLSI
ncbi:MAG TPA: ATP-binding protein [Usitatibacter sp.]|nr:ATP-binding protein [Usitatibacter sp.]